MDTSSAALDFDRQLTKWRHRFHRAPETGFEEHETSAFAAEVLEGFGLEVTRGIGGTGFVASLSCGDGRGVIGLRAEMDALNIHEQAPERDHVSVRAGKSHACGHDGHMSMVLGAAKLLCERRDFNGTVRFIFQAAEEHGKGAKAMIADKLFERFPVDEIYGVHNIPGLRAGAIATRAGGIMASEDNFVIRINGRQRSCWLCRRLYRGVSTPACRRWSPARSCSPMVFATRFPDR
jgi:amidohydrolase